MRRNPLHLIVALGPLLLAGCQTPPMKSSGSLAEAESAYRNEDFGRAVDLASAVVDRQPGGPEAARALYVRGMAYARTQQRASAYADLGRAVRSAADRDVTWRASAALGVLHFEDDNWESALSAFERAVDGMPNQAPMDALLYRVGLCRERTGRWRDALEAYRRVQTQFGDGPYAANARRRLSLAADHFSVQFGVYTVQRNAETQVQELRRQDVVAYVHEEPRDGVTYYVVLSGRYTNYADAVQALARMKGHVPTAVLWP